MSDNFFKIRNGVNLGSLPADPSPAQAGDIYFNSVTHKFRGYDGTNWSDIGSGSGAAPRSEVYVDTPNGSGAVGTAIRRFTNVQINQGTAISYVDDSNAGASFTVNEDGVYAISYGDYQSSGTNEHGVSVNATSLTTSITSLSFANGYRGLVPNFGNSQNQPTCFAITLNLLSGDIVRPHHLSCDNTTDRSYFNITKVSN